MTVAMHCCVSHEMENAESALSVVSAANVHCCVVLDVRSRVVQDWIDGADVQRFVWVSRERKMAWGDECYSRSCLAIEHAVAAVLHAWCVTSPMQSSYDAPLAQLV